MSTVRNGNTRKTFAITTSQNEKLYRDEASVRRLFESVEFGVNKKESSEKCI